MFFLYMGYVGYQYLKKRNMNITVLIICLLVWIVDIYFCKDLAVSMASARFPHVLWNLAGALAAICLIFALVKSTMNLKIMQKGYSWLRWIGENTMIVMCFHLLELDFLPWSWLSGFMPSWLFLAVKIVGRCLFVSLCVMIVNRIDVLKKIFR